jgi:cellulose biosynthesis protein BcsQ
MGIVISAFSHKGGVGKTTFIYTLAFALANRRKADGSSYKVMLIDADPQMNLSASVLGKSLAVDYSKMSSDKGERKIMKLGEEWHSFCEKHTSFVDRFTDYTISGRDGEVRREKVLFTSPHNKNIDILIGSANAAQEELFWTNIVMGGYSLRLREGEYQDRERRPYLFEKSIRDLKKEYDFVLIDTPPSATSVLTGLAVMSSDYFVVPVVPSFFSLQAVNNLPDILEDWIAIFNRFRMTGNRTGLHLAPKFLGLVVQRSRRYSRDEKRLNQYSKATVAWTNDINERLNAFYRYAITVGLSVEREKEFRQIFSESTPLIIDNICDFTLGLTARAERLGIPVIELNEENCPQLKPKDGSRDSDNRKAWLAFRASYDYLSESFCKLV